MAIDPITAIFSIGKLFIERNWPDPTKQAEEMRKLSELAQTGDLARLDAHVKLMMGQLEINKIEAQNKSLFVSGWRPGVGWVCLSGLTYPIVTSLFSWLLQVAAFVFGADLTDFPLPPSLETGALVSLLLGLLGMGAMRSYDKSVGVETNSLGKQPVRRDGGDR